MVFKILPSKKFLLLPIMLTTTTRPYLQLCNIFVLTLLSPKTSRFVGFTIYKYKVPLSTSKWAKYIDKKIINQASFTKKAIEYLLNRLTPFSSKIYYKKENYLKVKTVVFKYTTPPYCQVTSSPRLYVLFRTAVTGIKQVTRLPFVGLCGWVVQSLSPHTYSKGLVY